VIVNLRALPSPTRILMVRVCASAVPAERDAGRVVGNPSLIGLFEGLSASTLSAQWRARKTAASSCASCEVCRSSPTTRSGATASDLLDWPACHANATDATALGARMYICTVQWVRQWPTAARFLL